MIDEIHFDTAKNAAPEAALFDFDESSG